MASPSILISRINLLLHSKLSSSRSYRDSSVVEMSMGLRNLKVHLVCLRNLGNDDMYAMRSLFSRIEDAIETASTVDGTGSLAMMDNARAFGWLAEEVHDECEQHTKTISDHLTLDDVVEVADSLLDSASDFWDVIELRSIKIPNLEVMGEFEVHTSFLRDFLLFVKRIAVENQQLLSLLFHISPFILDAASMFMMDATSPIVDANWVKQVESKCPRVDPQVFQSYTQILLSISALDQTDDGVLKDFLGSLISLLWHLLRCHSDSLKKSLYECLRLSRFNWKQGQNNNNDPGDHIGVLIRDAGVVICSFYNIDVDPLISLSDLVQRFDVFQSQVLPQTNSSTQSGTPQVVDFQDGVESILDRVVRGSQQLCSVLNYGRCFSRCFSTMEDREVQVDTTMTSTQNTRTPPQVVGFQDDEVDLVLDRITRGSKHLRLVPISGMPGLGKTTFALKMYNHRSVMYHFQARAWCTISQVFEKKKVLLQLLYQVQPGDYSEMTEDDLANKLRQSLKGKRYLILLDDVWSPHVSESLRPSFPDDATQSRILLTSRLHAIVPHAWPDERPHFLRLRTKSECLEIIEMKLLHKSVGLSMELEIFAELCKGLPLTAVIIAGLLATTEQQGWEGILDRLSSGGISRMDQCNVALELSYKQLPDYLKLCFIYFGVFPEDEEIYAKKLVRLWMAESFVARRNDLRIEDVAQEHLEGLIQRNLVIVARKNCMGGIKTCKIHDLLHDFCLMKAKQHNIFHRLLQKDDGLSGFNEPCNLVRLSIHSDPLHFMEARLFCPRAHSILHFTPTRENKKSGLFDMLFIFQIYRHLGVLDMDFIRFRAAVPSEIGLLTRLTYLSISIGVPIIPSSIGNLSNLETLIVRVWAQESVPLPHTIWNLQNLKCIYITSGSSIKYAGFSFPIRNLENTPNLLELGSVCGVLLYSDRLMEKLTRKFPNIRKLKCHVLPGGKSSEEVNKIVVVPEFLSQLESLAFSTERKFQYQFDFGSTAANLRKVTLKGFVLSREEIAVMGKLPNLEALKLEDIVYLEGNMEMGEREFLKLRVLKLVRFSYHSNLETWTAIGDDALPCLEKLVFRGCSKLKVIPSCLEVSCTLQEIMVSSSSSTLKSLVRYIENVQKDYGNFIRVEI